VAPSEQQPRLTYRDAGVDIDAATGALTSLKELAASTRTPGVLADLGGFGGLFRFSGWRDAVLVASTDGVGTKLRVAFETGVHGTVGGDLVNHCVNDILVQGAAPLFFLDYFATGRLAPEVLVEVVRGMATACRAAGCALLGGETAEMPGFYRDGEYDIAGFIFGAVERDQLITGAGIEPGDRLLGLVSAGLHTNGYALARKVLFEVRGLGPADPLPGLGLTAGAALLAPHRSYLAPLRPLIEAGRLRGLAHITGGGITDNLPRVLPDGCAAEVRRGAWPVPPLFALIESWGGVPRDEMERTFNLGIGMILVVAPAELETVRRHLAAAGETVHDLGRIVEGERRVIYTDAG